MASSILQATGALHNGAIRRLTMIGAGRMAEAVISGIIDKGAMRPQDMVVYDINQKQSESIAKTYNINYFSSMQEAVEDSDVLVLAVKPNNVPDVAKTIGSSIGKDTVVLSLMAGVPIKEIGAQLKHNKIIRAMSNTPAFVSQGMTVWTGSDAVTEVDYNNVQELLRAVGEEILVRDEKYLDMATAISGSGPAYVMLAMEALTDSGVHLGFSRDVAKKLATQTMLGAVMYSKDRDEEHLAKLRNDVTSPGGTTASAIYELEKGGFRTVMSNAVWASYRRALEMGGSDSNVGPGRSHL
eukprot:CFRG2218T1